MNGQKNLSLAVECVPHSLWNTSRLVCALIVPDPLTLALNDEASDEAVFSEGSPLARSEYTRNKPKRAIPQPYKLAPFRNRSSCVSRPKANLTPPYCNFPGMLFWRTESCAHRSRQEVVPVCRATHSKAPPPQAFLRV